MNNNNMNKNTENNENEFKNPLPQNLNYNNANKMSVGLKAFLITIFSLFMVLLFTLISLLTYSFSKRNNIRRFKDDLIFQEQEVESDKDSSKSLYIDPNGPSIVLNDIPRGKEELKPEQIFKNMSPSIVLISVMDSDGVIKGYGSGVVLSENGYIVTNEHVVEKNMKVKTSDGNEYTANIVGVDKRTDLAVIKVEAEKLKPAVFGNSDQLMVGESVLSIGNPGGTDYSNTLTKGIISALDRKINELNTVTNYIQTDAAINPGSSGGALFDMYGQIVGINVSKVVSTSYEGIGFVIPMTTVKPVANDLIKQGFVSNRVKLGINAKEVHSKNGSINGIIIANIDKESDLRNKGVQKGDIITKINDKEVTSLNLLYSEFQNYKAGDDVKLTIFRYNKDNKSKSKTFEIDVKLLEDKP